MYDYGARHYDVALGMWGAVDQMAEKYYSISPYVYVANNPVRFIDPTGMFPEEEDPEREKRPSFIKQMSQALNYIAG